MNEPDNAIPYVPYLCLKTADDVQYFQLDPESNALVGVGGHCKIRLVGDDIRSLHCILSVKEDGLIEVRDWNTGSTYLNGIAISKPTMMAEEDLLQIGEYEISAVLVDDGRRPKVTPKNDSQSSESAIEEEQYPDFWTRPERPLESDLQSETNDRVAEEDSTIAVEPIADQQDGVEEFEAPSAVEEPTVDEPAMETATVHNVAVPVDAEEMHILRMEVDQLKFELEQQNSNTDANADEELQSLQMEVDRLKSELDQQRSNSDEESHNLRMEVDQLRAELKQRQSSSDVNPEFLSREQSLLMVGKLEELLAELKNSDIRSRQMEELLRVADQANHDEQQERKHIESWVSELESRVDQREAEARTEIQRLKTLLREAHEIQQKSNECLQGVMSLKTGSGESLPAELANGLYSQIESLQSQLKVAQDEKERLRQQFDQRNAELVTDIKAEQELAELQLRVSRERAEISRQRAELTRLKVDLVHRRVAEPPETSVFDSQDRVSAMDVHLSALHHGGHLQESSPIENDDGEIASRVINLMPRVSAE